MTSAARVRCNGRTRPGHPGRLGSGTAAAVAQDTSTQCAPLCAPLRGFFSVHAILTGAEYHKDMKMTSVFRLSPKLVGGQPILHQQDFGAENSETGPAVHCVLETLYFIDTAFSRPIVILVNNRVAYSIYVTNNTITKAGNIR